MEEGILVICKDTKEEKEERHRGMMIEKQIGK